MAPATLSRVARRAASSESTLAPGLTGRIAIEFCCSKGVQRLHPLQTLQGCKIPPQGVQIDNQGVQPIAPDPSEEIHQDPSLGTQESASPQNPENPESENPEQRKQHKRHALIAATFVSAWKVYPKREGGNSKPAAWKAFLKSARKGANPALMIQGTNRYAAWCREKGKVGTEYVMQGKTFFGPGEHWSEPWSPASESRRDGSKECSHSACSGLDECRWINHEPSETPEQREARRAQLKAMFGVEMEDGK